MQWAPHQLGFQKRTGPPHRSAFGLDFLSWSIMEQSDEEEQEQESDDNETSEEPADEEEREQPQPGDMNEDEAEMVLDSLRQLEEAQRERIMKDMIRRQMKNIPPVEKDW